MAEKHYSYFISFVGRDNKFGNMIADFVYELNTRENIKAAAQAIASKLNGNYRAIVYLKKLKYVEDKKNGLQTKSGTGNKANK